MLFRFAGGSFANSLAILTDAAHKLSDFATVFISLLSLWLATKHPNKRLLFGWHRAGKRVCLPLSSVVIAAVYVVGKFFLLAMPFPQCSNQMNESKKATRTSVYIIFILTYSLTKNQGLSLEFAPHHTRNFSPNRHQNQQVTRDNLLLLIVSCVSRTISDFKVVTSEGFEFCLLCRVGLGTVQLSSAIKQSLETTDFKDHVKHHLKRVLFVLMLHLSAY